MINSTHRMISFDHKRWVLACGAVLTLLTIPVSTVACSLVGCVDRGVELRRNFIVTVTHQDKPLPGVSVQITGNSDVAGHQSFLELTGVDGTAHFASLPPGDYWIKADLLGIEAGYECFDIKLSHQERRGRQGVTNGVTCIRQLANRLDDCPS